MKVGIKVVLALGSALATMQAAPGLAQSTGASAANAPRTTATESGDIIVTARRTEERLQDVPISITVFNQQQLTARNIVQAADLATYTPSLSADSLFGSLNTSFSLRGFNQQPGTSPTVGVYFADVIAPRGGSSGLPIGDGAGPGQLFDLQNVQILKGPQGTLFGLNTTGGSILLVPQKPTGKLEGYIEGSYGNYNMRRLQAVINIPLSDIARFRAAVDYQKRDGYLKNDTGIGPKDFDDVNYVAARASLDVDLTPNLETYIIGSYIRSDTHGDIQPVTVFNPAAGGLGFAGLAALQLAQRAAAGGGFYSVENSFPDPSTKFDQWQLIDTTTWHASDNLIIKNIASYSQQVEDIRSQFFGDRLDPYYFAVNFPPYGVIRPLQGTISGPGQFYLGVNDINRLPGAHTSNQSNFTEELQVQGTGMGGKLSYQAGGYLELSNPLGLAGSYSHSLISCPGGPDSTICANPLFGGGTANTTYGETKYRDIGTYAQASYSITDQLKFTGGIRYTWDKNSAYNISILDQYQSPSEIGSFGSNPVAGPPSSSGCTLFYANANCEIAGSVKSSAPTWLIDLDYKPMQNVLTYAKYSRGYRQAGVLPAVPEPYTAYKPEKLDAYEVGLKSSFHGAVSGSFNIAGFYNKFHNEQTIISFGPIVPGSTASSAGILNADTSRSYGVEVDASLTPFHGFTVSGGYAYLNTKILKIPPVFVNPSSGLFATSAAISGDPELYSPKNKYTVTGTYVLPVDVTVGKIAVSVTFSHSDSQLADYSIGTANGGFSDLSKLGPRNLVDLNLTWGAVAGSPIDLQAFATNVTDDKYYTARAGIYIETGYDLAGIGAPRMFGGRVKYHF